MIDFIFQMGRKAVNFDLGYFGNAEGIYLRQFVRIDDLCHRHHLSFFAGVGPIDSIMGYNDGFLIRLLVDKRLFLFLVITSDLCYFFTKESSSLSVTCPLVACSILRALAAHGLTLPLIYRHTVETGSLTWPANAVTVSLFV
jgi:hypothetical protein